MLRHRSCHGSLRVGGTEIVLDGEDGNNVFLVLRIDVFGFRRSSGTWGRSNCRSFSRWSFTFSYGNWSSRYNGRVALFDRLGTQIALTNIFLEKKREFKSLITTESYHCRSRGWSGIDGNGGQGGSSTSPNNFARHQRRLVSHFDTRRNGVFVVRLARSRSNWSSSHSGARRNWIGASLSCCLRERERWQKVNCGVARKQAKLINFSKFYISASYRLSRIIWKIHKIALKRAFDWVWKLAGKLRAPLGWVVNKADPTRASLFTRVILNPEVDENWIEIMRIKI